ncbi:MAG: NTP transferase domain-containing protein [Parvularculaceae bacterium]
MKIGVILAGGLSKRMGEGDKARADIGGKSLIFHVVDRFAPQVDALLISGDENYETGLPFVRDIKDEFSGPAAGLWASLAWLEKHHPSADGFYTVPVDGPFLPLDLTERLSATAKTCVATTSVGDHPTFAYWRLRQLRTAFSTLETTRNLSLRHLASLCHAEKVCWECERSFLNINSPEDLAAARNFILRKEKLSGAGLRRQG